MIDEHKDEPRLARFGRACGHWLLRRFRATEYIDLLASKDRDSRHSWTRPFFYTGCAITVLSAVFIVLSEALIGYYSSLTNQPPGVSLQTLALFVGVLYFFKAALWVIITVAIAVCLAALVDVSVRVGVHRRAQDFRVALGNLLGVTVLDSANQVAIVIGDITVRGTNRPAEGAKPDRPDTRPENCSPLWNTEVDPDSLVGGVAADVVHSEHSQFAMIADITFLTVLFDEFARAGLGMPKIMYASAALKDLESTDSQVRCYISVGLFSNAFTLSFPRQPGRGTGEASGYRLGRMSRLTSPSGSDRCCVSFPVPGQPKTWEEFWVSFDWDGAVTSSSPQLVGSDFGLLARITIEGDAEDRQRSVIVIGGGGPQGTIGMGTAIRSVIGNNADLSMLAKVKRGDPFAALYRVNTSDVSSADLYRLYG